VLKRKDFDRHSLARGARASGRRLASARLRDLSQAQSDARAGPRPPYPREVLATLTPREEQILRMRFAIDQNTDCTLEEVGKRFAVTRERIRQIEAKTLRKLRTTERWRNLEGFLGREPADPKGNLRP